MLTKGNVARWLSTLLLAGTVAGCSGGHHHSSVKAAATGTSSPPLQPGTTGASTTAPTTTAAADVGPVGGPVPSGFQPSSVSFVSAADGWALGDAPCGRPPCTSVVRTVDGGRTWRGVPAPVAPFDASPGRLGTGTGVYGVRFADRRDGWAYGTQVWATHDAGATWHQVALPGLTPGEQVEALEATAGVVLAAVGPASGGAITLDRSAAGTDQWSTVASSAGQAPVQLVLSGRRGWLVPTATPPVGPGWLTTSDVTAAGGWAPGRGPCAAGDQGGLLAAAPSGVVDVVCAGPAGAGQEEKPVFVAAGGTRFAAVAPAPLGGDLEAVAAPSSTSLVVAAASGASELYLTTDGGRTWTTALQETTGGVPFEQLGFTTPSQGVALLGVPTAAGSPSTGIPPSVLLMSRDGGRSWAPVTFGG
ncbi:MAG TPA: hypothetical protein VGI06_04875 [Acidimicrobiales bacterium]